jgi:transposase
VKILSKIVIPVLHNYLTNNYPACTITVIYEAGFNGFWLHDHLVKDGLHCIVTPPNKVTEEKCNRVKNNRIDAQRLAKNLENGDFKVCFTPDEELRTDRQISRSLIQLEKNIIMVKNRIRKFLDFHNLNADLSSGKWTMRHYRALYKLLPATPLDLCLSHYLAQLQFFISQKKLLRKALFKVAKKERYQRMVESIDSTPGIGKYTAIRLALEWGNIATAFPTGRARANFVGLVASEFSTGPHERRGHITKQGHRFVRRWLVQCAWASVRKDPVLLDKFERVRLHSGSKCKAVIAVAREMVVRIHSLVRQNQTYCCQRTT